MSDPTPSLSADEMRIIRIADQAKRVPGDDLDDFLKVQLPGDDSAQSLVRDLLAGSINAGPLQEAFEFLEGAGQPSDFPTPAQSEETTDLASDSDSPPMTVTAFSGPIPEIEGYRMGQVIGRGGMGMVVQAFDEQLQIEVAIKLIRAERSQSESARGRFLREARSVAKLRHPNIVGILQVGETPDSTLWFAMELVEGEPLPERIPKNGMGQREAARIARQVAEALGIAHQADIYHRDIKPANVLLDRFGQARVIDFGLAKNSESDLSQTLDGQVVGTPQYMAPEQIDSTIGPIGQATDLYALGGLLYYLLVGQPPHNKNDHHEQFKAVLSGKVRSPELIRSEVDRDLAAICLKCLSLHPEDRYVDAQSLIEDLRRYEEKKPVMARPIGAVDRAMRWGRRNPIAVGVGATLAGLLLVAAFFWRRAGENEAVATARATQLAQTNEVMRQQVYGADIRDAFQSLTDGDFTSAFAQAIELIPEPGEADRRGIEWRLLWHRLIGPYRMLHSPGSYFSATVNQFSLSPDNQTLAYNDLSSGGTSVWNYAEGKLIGRYLNVRIPKFLADGTTVVCLVNEELSVCDARSFKPRQQMPLDGEFRDAFSNADGSRFGVLTRKDKRYCVRVYDTETVDLLHTTEAFDSEIRKACLSPDGSLIATGHVDGNVRISNMVDQKVRVLDTDFQSIGVNFSQDGRYLVSCPLGYSAKVWETKTWTEVATLSGNDKAWRMAQFTPDNRYLIMSGFDGRIWQYRTEDWSLNSQHSADLTVWWGEISADGNTLVLGGSAGARNRFEGATQGGDGIRIFHLDRDFEQGFKWHDWGTHFGNSTIGGEYVRCSTAADMSHVVRLDKSLTTLNRLALIGEKQVDRSTIRVDREVDEIQTFASGRYTGSLFADGSLALVDWDTSEILPLKLSDHANVLYRDPADPGSLWIVADQSITRLTPGKPFVTSPLQDIRGVLAMDRYDDHTFIANDKTVVMLDPKMREMWRHTLADGRLLDLAAADSQSALVSTSRHGLESVNEKGFSIWSKLRFSPSHLAFSDDRNRLLVRANPKEVDAIDVNTRRAVGKFRTTKGGGRFEVDPKGQWLVIDSARTRAFRAATEQDVLNDLLAMAETENANDLVLTGLNRQLRFMGLDDSTIRDATRLAMFQAQARNQTRLASGSSMVPWVKSREGNVETTKSSQLAQKAKQKIARHFQEIHSDSPPKDLQELWRWRPTTPSATDETNAPESQMREAFDSIVGQIPAGTRVPMLDTGYQRIAWMGDRELLTFNHQDIRLFNLLSGEHRTVASVPDHIWTALHDPARRCLYVGTGGTWMPDVKRLVCKAPVRLLRFDTETWESKTLYEYDEGKILHLHFINDQRSLLVTGEGTKSVRIELETETVQPLEMIEDVSAMAAISDEPYLFTGKSPWRLRKVDPLKDQSQSEWSLKTSGRIDFLGMLKGGEIIGMVSPPHCVGLIDAKNGQWIQKHELNFPYETKSIATDEYLLAGIHNGRLLQLFAKPNMQPRNLLVGGKGCQGIEMLPGHPDVVVISTDEQISLMRLPPVEISAEEELRFGLAYIKHMAIESDASAFTLRDFQDKQVKQQELTAQLDRLLEQAESLDSQSSVVELTAIRQRLGQSWQSFVDNLPDGFSETVAPGYCALFAALPNQQLCLVRGNRLELLDLKTGKLTPLLTAASEIYAITTHPSLPIVYLGTGARWDQEKNKPVNDVPAQVIAYNTKTHQRSELFHSEGRITHLEIIEDEQLLIAGEWMSLYRHDLRSHETTQLTSTKGDRRIGRIPGTENQHLLMRFDGQGFVVDMRGDLEKLKPDFEMAHQQIHAITVLADGKHGAAVTWADSLLILFDLETGETVRQIDYEKRGPEQMTAHPNGRGIWVGTKNQELIYVDVDPDVPVERMKFDQAGPLCIEWLEQECLLVVSGIDGVRIIKPFGSELQLNPPLKPPAKKS